ncbi:hypothetical protein F4824DRAFT_129086 [Ustulina deusta]|nr:hypothetical protein F4824DRAFT_129086 [Ustulina deusta]
MTTVTTATTRSLLTTAKLPATRARTGGSKIPWRTYSSQPRRGPNTTVKFWPFLAIIVVGTGAFAYVSKSRAGQGTFGNPSRQIQGCGDPAAVVANMWKRNCFGSA